MNKEIEKKLTLEEKINKMYEDKEEDLKLFGNYNLSQIYKNKKNLKIVSLDFYFKFNH